MKSTLFTAIMLFVTASVTHAQLSFLPQVGFEKSRTTLQYNSLSTTGVEGNIKASLKMDYRFKGGHGPFINLGTSPAPVNFSFNNTGSLIKNYQAVENNLQFRMEAGYQYSSKPIQLTKTRTPKKTSDIVDGGVTQKKSCGSVSYKSNCGVKKSIQRATFANNLNMRLQPSLALAYVPSNSPSLKQTPNGFEYNATNWKTALVPALGFEFANGKQRLFTISVFYTKPLGLSDETITSFSGSKGVATHLSPKASTWGMTIGVPFSFTSGNTGKAKKVKKERQKTYYRRCSKI